MSLSPADYITIVFHQININNLGLDFLENIMKEQKVPLAYYDIVKEEVIKKFKKEVFKIYAKFEQTNPDIFYCKEKDRITNKYLNAYFDKIRTKFSKERKSSISLLNFNSEEILQSLPNPVKTECHYKIKGLVIGQVQSGKTANIESIICRAVDYGYRMVIILSGRTNDLRYQTQKRFDVEVIENSYLNKEDRWVKLTNESKDYDSGSTEGIDTNPEKPKIAIIKKNVSVLKKILNSINKLGIENHPTLIIDDECDDASIDTNYGKPDTDPTATNQKIRSLINSFNKVVYIGFSATPFANVFIDVNESEDLYPKDFIYLLETPKGYTGSEELEKNKQKIFVDVKEENQSDKFILETLKDSIYSFIISCAICKNLDVDLNNYSMLIHPSRLKIEHSSYKDAVEKIAKYIKSYEERPNIFSDIEKKFKEIFVSTFSEDIDKPFDFYLKDIKSFIKKIDVQTINSDTQDRSFLNYDEIGKVYILIGGNILSRGLTVDGLLTSFFTRDAKKTNYDTLIQMQRWCGFRKKYLKFTRIYTTPKIKKQLFDLVSIEKDFRQDIREIYDKDLGQTPIDIQPMIRNHDSMNIVSSNKQGASLEKISANAKSIKFQTLSFHKEHLQHNIKVIHEWSKDKNLSQTKNGLECSIDKEEIRRFIESYKCSEGKKRGKTLQERILNAMETFDDSNWNVIIHTPKKVENPSFFHINNTQVTKVRRALYEKNNIFNITFLFHKQLQQKQITQPTIWFYIIDENTNKHEKQRGKNVDSNIVAPNPILAFYIKSPRISSLNGIFSTQDPNRF